LRAAIPVGGPELMAGACRRRLLGVPGAESARPGVLLIGVGLALIAVWLAERQGMGGGPGSMAKPHRRPDPRRPAGDRLRAPSPAPARDQALVERVVTAEARRRPDPSRPRRRLPGRPDPALALLSSVEPGDLARPTGG
jgi:hypothetical protein